MAILLGPAVALFLQHGKTVDVNIAGAKQPTVDEIELTFDGDPKHALHPISITPHTDDPMAIVFVVNGAEIWMGNDQVETDPNQQYVGILANFELAIEKLELAKRLPPDSEAGIVTYATGAKVRMPLSPIAQLHGSSFGTQQDYRGQTGTDLVAGVEAGLDEVSRAGERTKVLIVMGSDMEGVPATAKQPMEALLRRAETMHVAVAAIVYKSDSSLGELLPMAKAVNSTDGIVSELNAIVDLYKKSFHATFDLSKAPVWDNKPHSLTVRVDGQETAPTSLTLGLYGASARRWTSVWFRIAFAAAILVVFGIVALRVVVARRAAS